MSENDVSLTERAKMSKNKLEDRVSEQDIVEMSGSGSECT